MTTGLILVNLIAYSAFYDRNGALQKIRAGALCCEKERKIKMPLVWGLLRCENPVDKRDTHCSKVQGRRSVQIMIDFSSSTAQGENEPSDTRAARSKEES